MKIRFSDMSMDLSLQETEETTAAEYKDNTPDEDCPEMMLQQLSQFHSEKYISVRTLDMMDESIRHMRKSIVSDPVDLSEFNG